MEQEVNTLLRKEAIEVVPPLDRESGFYSRYFIVPMKDGGLRPILDMCQLNRSVMRLKFRMLSIEQVVSQTRSKDCFVTIDLKDAYFHISILPHHREFLRFALEAKFTYTGFFLSALHPHPALSQSVWMLLWLLCDSRASAYSFTSTFGWY